MAPSKPIRYGIELELLDDKSTVRAIAIRSRKLRPRRSSFQTMSLSPSCNALRQRSRAGRLVVAPDKPSSLKTVCIRPASRPRAARLYSGRQSIRGHSRISWFNYGLDI